MSAVDRARLIELLRQVDGIRDELARMVGDDEQRDDDKELRERASRAAARLRGRQ